MDGTIFYKVTITFYDHDNGGERTTDTVIIPTMCDEDSIMDVYQTAKENRNGTIISILIEEVTYVDFNEMEKDQWIDIGIAMGWLTSADASRDIVRNEDGTEKFSDTWD